MLRMIDRFDGQINVQNWPVKVVRVGALHRKNRGNRDLTKPGEVFEGQEDFAISQEQPDSVRGDAGNLNLQSACAMPRGFHRRAPESAEGLSPAAVAKAHSSG
jgi:hypothetical protein